jgi:hypothetical protein
VSIRGGSRRVVANLLVAFTSLTLLPACRVDIATTVNVAESGGGTISVIVTADAEVVRGAPELATSLSVDDLRAAGWDATVQNPTADGGLSLTLTRGFTKPDEANEYLAQLSGANGPLRDLRLSREGGFADDDALAALGVAPFASTLAASNLSLGEALGVTLRVLLPGSPLGTSSGAVTRDDEDLSTTFTWTVPVDGSSLDLTAGTRNRNISELLASIAANGFLVLIVLLAIAFVAYCGSVIYRRSRSTPGS